ncbi:diguanylate cyclase [Pseudoxanthomonas sp. LH2527]|uniref:sensor domain-containing diguanylate cyclase n=1 Tax=Pseudoxanthomonas sp. LH2527 TaxID=2923249 RepID=UPI001F1422F3|nr:diguanylate cyclase [Pseudoxanthomonas sp. LH2527]MCH6482786.1 diguanylate cyclase [Pseudoxanthomonas sp. LH2527]
MTDPDPPTGRVPRPSSLRRQFARAVVLAALLPAAVLGVVEQVRFYQAEQRHVGERLEVITILSATAVEDFVGMHQAGVALVASMSGQDTDWPARLAELRRRYPGFSSVLVTDANGTVQASQPVPPRGPAINVADRDYFRMSRQTAAPFVSDAFRGRRLSNDPLVAVAAPWQAEGAFAGVVQGSIRVDTFTDSRVAAIRRRGVEMLLLDRERRVIRATEGLPYRFQQSLAGSPLLAGAGQGVRETESRRLHDAMADGRAAWVSQATLSSGWTLVLLVPDTQLMGAVGRRALATAGLLMLIAAGVWLAYAWQMRRLDGALAQLAEALQALAVHRRPSATARLPEEFEPMGRAVGELSEQLEAAHADLQRALDEQSELSLSLQRTLERREQDVERRTAELRMANAELDRLNRIDPLTGCLNRRGLQHALAPLGDEAGELLAPLAVIALDVDHFKAFNDRYGHAAGDSALRRVAAVVAGAPRRPQDAAARTGGEEFLILVSQAEAGEVAAIAEHLRSAVQALAIAHADSPWGVLTVSVGWVRADPGADYAQAFLLADEALYRAKHGGRNRVERE